MFKSKVFDLVILVTLILLSSAVILLFDVNFLFATLLYFGLPSAFLIYKKPSNLLKAFLSAVVFGGLWSFSFDFLAEFNNAWNWDSNTDLVFSSHLFGVVSLDIMVWYILWIFLIVSYYEYFVEYDFSKQISKHIQLTLITGVVVAVILVSLHKFYPQILKINYVYLWLGLAALVAYLLLMIKKPTLFKKSMKVIPFFSFLYITFEIVALEKNLWSFPGEYIGVISILGHAFPVEEFIFWIIFSSAIATAFHEYGVDNFE
ncbi:hypothetical protein KC866_01940 [Patescibacteria group bacterium]|nr:hypothetical protein [Patescibacteria group bacterium]